MIATRTNGNVTIKFTQPGLQTGKNKDGETTYTYVAARAAITCVVSMPDAAGNAVRHAITAAVNCKTDECATELDARAADYRWRSGGAVLAALPGDAKEYVLGVLDEVLAELSIPTGRLGGWFFADHGQCVPILSAPATVRADSLVYHDVHTGGEWVEARQSDVLREILGTAWVPDMSAEIAQAQAKLEAVFGKALPATAAGKGKGITILRK